MRDKKFVKFCGLHFLSDRKVPNKFIDLWNFLTATARNVLKIREGQIKSFKMSATRIFSHEKSLRSFEFFRIILGEKFVKFCRRKFAKFRIIVREKFRSLWNSCSFGGGNSQICETFPTRKCSWGNNFNRQLQFRILLGEVCEVCEVSSDSNIFLADDNRGKFVQ